MFKTIRNAFKVKELKNKLLYTFMMLVVIRFGSALPIPGVRTDFFANWFAKQTTDVFGFFNAMTGGSFSQMSIFALSITPYITSSIIIMDPELTSFKTMFDYKLEPEVYNFHLLDALVKAAEKEGITNFPVHIKLDTGMHRLGFAEGDVPLLIRRLKNQNALIPRSVFSHFVGSDSPQFDAFTRQQIEIFERASVELQRAFPHKILRHICNTAGIERFPGAQFDMVRLGIGLYGVSPIDNSVINNVSTLKTTILQIRDVAAEDTVGYSRKGHLERPSRIAAIPIGYADGLNRHLGCGHAYCLVNGKKAPYVGNICMDVCMIDVTGIDCQEGDPAIIFGDDLPITVLSDVLDTIPYEVLTSVSTRVKRVYYQD